MKIAVVFDLEFTAWAGSMRHRWLRPGEFREIVQIGAVKVDADTFAAFAEFVALVIPRLNPVLSPYFEELTGITNAELVQNGRSLLEAYGGFLEFVGDAPVFAFGRDDLVLEDNLRLYGLTQLPLLRRFTNVVPWLAERGIETRGLHACDIAGAAGAQFAGRKHDALDDARSVALGISTLLAKGSPNPLSRECNA